MIASLRRAMIERLQIAGTVASITLGMLNATTPEPDLGRPIAFERTVNGRGPSGFDPREIVARRIIITLPLSDDHATGDRSWFVPN